MAKKKKAVKKKSLTIRQYLKSLASEMKRAPNKIMRSSRIKEYDHLPRETRELIDEIDSFEQRLRQYLSEVYDYSHEN